MYFKINKKELIDQINIVSRAVSQNSPLPVLHNIKLSVKDNYIKLVASDSDISIQTTIFTTDNANLEIYNEGDILLDGTYFPEMIRKIDSDKVEIELMDGTLINIRGLEASFELNCIKADNYPLIDFSKPENSFSINSDLLKNMINQTCFAASDKEVKPILTGINLNCQDNKLTCIATDSYRLAQKVVLLNDTNNFNVTIPSKSLNDISKIINNDGDVIISMNDKKILFEIDNIIVQTRLIDGLYPETSRLIPNDFQYELTVDARDILNAIDRGSFIKTDGFSIVKLEMKENEVIATVKSGSDAVLSNRIVPISYTGEPLSISFKGNYVYDAIRALNSLTIKIQFCGVMKPFILKSMDNDDILQLVLPIKTYN